MTRYVPTVEEQAAIDRLRLAGYAVVRQRTYDRLLERVALSEHRETWTAQVADDARKWARDSLAEERRMHDRLTEVATAAASLGVPIQAINTALAKADTQEQTP